MNARWQLTSPLLGALLVLGTCGAVVKAANHSTKFAAELQRLRAEWRAAQAAEGLSQVGKARAALYAKYSTPEITLCKPVAVKPGASAPVTVSGAFQPNTTFLLEDDRLTLGTPTVSATQFGATVTAAADALPSFVRLFAYTPVSGASTACGVAMIAATPRFSLTASNGWTVSLAPDAPAWTISGTEATLPYKAEYFKPGTTTAFETLSGRLSLSASATPSSDLWFSLQPSMGGAMEEYQKLTARMSDPQAFLKMSEKEQAAFQKQLERVSERMGQEMSAMAANPEVMLEKQAAFGCGDISLRVDGRSATGSVSCGEKVGRLTFTGTRE